MNVSPEPAPVRVLHVTAVAETAAIIVGPLVRHQLAAGYAVDVACARSRSVDGLIEAGVTVHDVPFSRKLLTIRHLSALFGLGRVIRAGKYHVVHAHTPVAAFLARIAAGVARVPVVIYHLRGSFWEARSSLARSAYTAAEWVAARFTTHVLTINCTDAEEVVRRGIMPARSVTCLHCG